jgi:ubiquinol-cytochrome c reductase cytochrome c1 subunit
MKLAAAGFAALGLAIAAPAFAQEHGPAPAAGGAEEHQAAGGHHLAEPAGGWSFDGFFGAYDQNQLQRGYKVYKEVCATCHGMRLMSFRNLGQPGGPFYDPEYANPNDNPVVKTIAAEFMLPAIDPETGDPAEAAGKTADGFPSPYANDAAARALNGGALPPDLSVMAKARHGGASYIYSLLTGFHEPPAGLTVNPGQHYNPYFAGDTAAQWAGDPREKPPGGFLAMAPPLLRDGQVTYDDDTAATIPQMAADVAAFISWSSEPKMAIRKQMGVAVIGYLLILAVLVYLSYRRIWRNVEH